MGGNGKSVANLANAIASYKPVIGKCQFKTESCEVFSILGEPVLHCLLGKAVCVQE